MIEWSQYAVLTDRCEVHCPNFAIGLCESDRMASDRLTRTAVANTLFDAVGSAKQPTSNLTQAGLLPKVLRPVRRTVFEREKCACCIIDAPVL